MLDTPVTLGDEIDALVACCWRYGSYTHMLTGGELFPAFRSNSELSRVDDSEMKRINNEFSASLADWLRLRIADQPRLTRRVRAALECLPVPWRSRRQPWWEDWVRHAAKRRAEDLIVAISQLPGLDLPWSTEPGDRLRRAANWMVLASYRNGPVEDLHAGTWSHGSEIPSFLRLYAEDLTKVASNISVRLAIHLLTYDHMAPEAQDLCASAGAPRDWSLTDETSSVAFYGMPDAGDLLARLRYLALRYPKVFGAEIRAG